MVADFQVQDRVPFAEVKVAAEFMMKQYLEGLIDTIEVIYPRFKNTLVQQPVLRPVLPLRSLKEFVDQLGHDTGTVRVPQADAREVLFEPDAKGVLNALLPFYVNHQIHQLALSAKASEHSARMVAMKTANDNATDLLSSLTLEFNKARQAAITQEILEIAAASFSSS
jgi:F-type H+-transporting ATPase subunit gamma